MIKQLDQVAEFHEKFKVGDGTAPVLLSPQDSLLRYKLMREENQEYLDACEKGDLVEIADALGDQLYILCGTILRHGLQHKIEDVFAEIHRSNMSKLGDNGEPVYREDGKIIKGPNYSQPNIRLVLDL